MKSTIKGIGCIMMIMAILLTGCGPSMERRNTLGHNDKAMTYVYKEAYGQDIALDIIMPSETLYDTPPLLVYFHGGGYISGDKSRAYLGDFVTEVIASFQEQGYAVASVNYTLANKKEGTSMYDCIIDSKDAIRWLHTNAKMLAIDNENMVLFGTSAGGGLVSFLGHTKDDEFLGDPSLKDAPSHVSAVINFYGGDTRFLAEQLEGITSSHPLSSDEEKYLNNELYKIGSSSLENLDDIIKRIEDLSVMTYLDSDGAPTLSLHGSSDRTVKIEQSRMLHQGLLDLGVDSYLYELEGYGHGLPGLSTDEKESYLTIIKDFARDNYKDK